MWSSAYKTGNYVLLLLIFCSWIHHWKMNSILCLTWNWMFPLWVTQLAPLLILKYSRKAPPERHQTSLALAAIIADSVKRWGKVFISPSYNLQRFQLEEFQLWTCVGCFQKRKKERFQLASQKHCSVFSTLTHEVKAALILNGQSDCEETFESSCGSCHRCPPNHISGGTLRLFCLHVIHSFTRYMCPAFWKCGLANLCSNDKAELSAKRDKGKSKPLWCLSRHAKYSLSLRGEVPASALSITWIRKRMEGEDGRAILPLSGGRLLKWWHPHKTNQGRDTLDCCCRPVGVGSRPVYWAWKPSIAWSRKVP